MGGGRALKAEKEEKREEAVFDAILLAAETE